MASIVNNQPTTLSHTNAGQDNNAFDKGPVRVRKMRKEQDDCKFVADMSVEGFRDKYIHATSVNSLPKVKEHGEKTFSIQDAWFYDRNLIAEYNGQRAGTLMMKYHGDPEQNTGDSYESSGCCHGCCLSGLEQLMTEDVSPGYALLDRICVDENFRGKGIGKVLLDRAECDAREHGCTTIYLYVSWTNRAKSLYERQGYKKTTSHCVCGCLLCFLGIKGVYRMDKDLN